MTKLTMALLFIGATIIALIITKKVLNHGPVSYTHLTLPTKA